MGNAVPGGRSRKVGGIVTFSTVAALVAGLALTVFGLGAAERAVAVYDASAWVWSSAKSELSRVNGRSGRIDTRARINGSASHHVQVSQSDRFLILRDPVTGKVTSLDLATLQASAALDTQPGAGIRVAMHDDRAFVVDTVQGAVRQLDAKTLQPVGDPITFSPGMVGGAFDARGRLWVASPSDGTATAIVAEAAGPRTVITAAIGDPRHDLVLSALDTGVAVLDQTAGALVTLRADKPDAQPSVRKLPLSKPGTMPARTSGDNVPVTVIDDRHVYVVMNEKTTEFTVPGEGGKLAPAVAWSGHYYIADDPMGTVYQIDANGAVVNQIKFPGSRGPLELEVRENRLFINDVGGSTARVVDNKHQVKVVDKYANDVIGGDPPKKEPPKQPVVPPKGPPSAPLSVVATAGNASARLSWSPAAENGAPITKYVVEGGDKPFEIGARQRAVEIQGLTNGKTYQFSVHAVNAKGAGPKRMSNPVTPTAAVPDPPISVTAVAGNDGTVKVSWPPANGQGNKIAKYAVTQVESGVQAPAGETNGTELTLGAGRLDYGKVYAFLVTAVNDKGAASKPSPLSNSVTPRTVPGAPKGLSATSVKDKKGTIRAAWQPAEPNGAAVRRYVVEATGKPARNLAADATSVELDGFGDGQNVQVKVRAVNDAGEGPTATKNATTIKAPTISGVDASTSWNSITVKFSVNDGGSGTGAVKCELQVQGAGTAKDNCASLTVNGLEPGRAYSFTVKARNAAGEDTKDGRVDTKELRGIVCHDCNNGIGLHDAPNYHNGSKGLITMRKSETGSVHCKTSGESISRGTQNGGKAEVRSTVWVKMTFQGKTGYAAWIWINTGGGTHGFDGDVANRDALPNCT